MSDVQLTVVEGDVAQVIGAIPGPQGPAGAGVPTGGAANEVLYKVTSTFGDTAWGPITSAMIGDLQIVNADVSASAGIAYSKLATLTSGNIVLGNASNVATSTAVTGDVTISNAGVTAISSGVIVDADVNASAAIAGTKISPNFGSQNVTTTGTSTAASFIPTSSTAPTNGVYLPAANSVAISTGGLRRMLIQNNEFRFGAPDSNPVVFNIGNEATGDRAVYADLITDTTYTDFGLRLGREGGASSTSFLWHRGTGDFLFLTSEAAPIKFSTSNLERARIRSDGMFEVKGAGTAGASPAFSVSGSAPTNSLIVDSSGNVGIGQTYGLSGLTVKGQSPGSNGSYATGQGSIVLNEMGRSSIATDAGGIEFKASVFGSGYGAKCLALDDGTLVIGTRSNSATWIERLRIAATSGQLSHIGAGSSGSPAVSFSGSAPANSALIDSSGRLLLGTSTNTGGSLFQVNDNRIRIATAKTPASATDTGSAGEICWDANYIYVCTATNTWKRTAISTW